MSEAAVVLEVRVAVEAAEAARRTSAEAGVEGGSVADSVMAGLEEVGAAGVCSPGHLGQSDRHCVRAGIQSARSERKRG